MSTQSRTLTALEQSEILLDLARDVTSTLEVQEVFEKGLAAISRLVDCDGGSIQLIEDGVGSDGPALKIVAGVPSPTPETFEVRIPVGRGVGGRIVATGEPIYIPDILEDTIGDPEGKAKAVSPGLRSYFGAPIILEGRAVGIIQIDSTNPDAFSVEARALVLAFLPTIAAAVQNARVYAREIDSLRRLQQAEKMKNDFVSLVSHELRTPLTSVMGFALTIAAHADELDPEKVKEFGHRIMTGGKRLEQLIESLLDASRIEREWARAKREPIELARLVRAAAADFEKSPVQFVIDIRPGLPNASGDPDSLRQILRHLISNACKFSPEGSTVTIRAAADRNGSLEVSVSDQGRGIPLEHLPKIWDRFFQVEPASTRSVGGLGIGLYLVKMLAERMDANIRAQSEVGRGTTFTISLQQDTTESGYVSAG